MVRKRRVLLAGAALGLAGVAAPTHDMRFWYADKAAARRAGARGFEDHPCGAVAVARVARMPAYTRHGALEPELIVEYGAGGRELRRWSAPVDGAVWAVRGDEVLINLAGRYYWIGTDGRIRPTRYADPPPITTVGQCGTPAGMAESDYAACDAFRDEGDGRVRNIWWQRVCT
jgi:hypothetical protein